MMPQLHCRTWKTKKPNHVLLVGACVATYNGRVGDRVNKQFRQLHIMAQLLVSKSLENSAPDDAGRRVVLVNDGYYWFLYWYFEAANLPPRNCELIGLYADAELSGYQLQRFIAELEEARADALCKPELWNILVGWNGADTCRESERRLPVERSKLIA
ncbi:MAG: hypothetical protein K8R46_02390, partial [Pirellulales bacterium]|nr:hypothetical protein [Pirellulales bacterium]